MTINELTITARATSNYQVGEVSVTASNISGKSDIEQLENLTIGEAVKVLNKLCDKIEKPVEDVKTEVTITKPEEEEEPVIGDKKLIDGFWYKYCFSKDKNSHFWALVDKDDAFKGAKKYINCDKKN